MPRSCGGWAVCAFLPDQGNPSPCRAAVRGSHSGAASARAMWLKAHRTRQRLRISVGPITRPWVASGARVGHTPAAFDRGGGREWNCGANRLCGIRSGGGLIPRRRCDDRVRRRKLTVHGCRCRIDRGVEGEGKEGAQTMIIARTLRRASHRSRGRRWRLPASRPRRHQRNCSGIGAAAAWSAAAAARSCASARSSPRARSSSASATGGCTSSPVRARPSAIRSPFRASRAAGKA